jgi:hypothetical protein
MASQLCAESVLSIERGPLLLDAPENLGLLGSGEIGSDVAKDWSVGRVPSGTPGRQPVLSVDHIVVPVAPANLNDTKEAGVVVLGYAVHTKWVGWPLVGIVNF